FEHSFQIDEFLFRLNAGTRQDQFLRDAVSHSERAATISVAQFLLGQIDEHTVDASLGAASESSRCTAHFQLLWYAELTNRPAMARRHFDALRSIGSPHCSENIVFARKFGFRE